MNLIGLPSLPKLPSGKGLVNNILASAQGRLWQFLTLEPNWGIYKAGSSAELAVEVDSVLELTLNEESDVPDYRLQTASFASYNKVAGPAKVSLQITKSGDSAERGTFVAWLRAAKNQPTTFDILTPEVVHHNMTLKEFSLDRSREDGMDRIIAECHFLEIREAPEQYYDAQQGKASTENTTDADGKPTVVEKKVEAQPAGTTGERVQDVFSLQRLEPVYTSIKTTAAGIVSAIENTASSYYKKVKGWFS